MATGVYGEFLDWSLMLRSRMDFSRFASVPCPFSFALRQRSSGVARAGQVTGAAVTMSLAAAHAAIELRVIAVAIRSGKTSGVQANAGTPSAASAAGFDAS
jgi:hypothetical protein